MRQMKDSGIEWIGEIPQDWTVKKLRFLGSINGGGVDKKVNDDEKQVRLVNYMDVYSNEKNHELYNSTNYMIVTAKDNQIENAKLLKGDILFTPSSETIEDIGLSAVVMEDLDNTLYSYHVLRLRQNSKKELDEKYSKYAFNNRYIYQYFSSLARGTTRMTLSRDDFNSCMVVFPNDINTQKTIADYLDKKCSEIDTCLTDVNESILKLQEYKKSIITEAVTKGLDPNAEMKDSGIEWIGETPQEFSIEKIKYKYYLESGCGFPVHLQGEETEEIPFYKVSDINGEGIFVSSSNNYVSKKTAEQHKFNIIPKGAIIFGKIGEALKKNHRKISQQECIVDNNMQALIGKEDSLKIDFAKYVFSQIDMVWFDNGGTIPSINNYLLLNYKIPVPFIDVQQQIADYLDNKCAEIDNVIEGKKELANKLKEYKNSLIYECVTGKREVG